MGRAWLAEHRRRLLRHHARAHSRHGRGGARLPAAPGAGGPPGRAAPLRHGGVQSRREHRFHDDRRADERHRLAEVFQADPSRRLRGRARRRAPAGGERRERHRHQHGRGDARRRRRDDALPESHRGRAGYREGADHGRFFEVERDRGRPALPAREGDREFDFAQGRRGEVPRAGAARPPLRRGGGRHGFR